MRTWRTLFLLAVFLGLAAPAQALEPSFDCAKAGDVVERAICQDFRLAQQDLDLAALYGVAREIASGDLATRLRDSQRAWLRARKAVCVPVGAGPDLGDEAQRLSLSRCLSDQYQARISALTGKTRRPLAVTEGPLFDATDAGARLCFYFNHKLVRDPALPLESFLRTEPPIQAAAHTQGNSLCYEGFAPAQRYDIALLQGLPSRGGPLLAERALGSVVTNDLPARLRFASSGRILPSIAAAGLPLETVNVEAVALTVTRITDRDLREAIRLGRVRNQLRYRALGQILSSVGEELWRSVIEIEGPRNATVKTALPIDEALADRAPGVYLAIVHDQARRTQHEYYGTTQWFTISDIGLTSFQGEDGLTVLTRSAHDGAALEGIEVTLRAAGNDMLASVVTDSDGLARIDPGFLRGAGEDAPALLTATGPNGDFVYLEMDAPVLDMSDRGVTGRAAPGPVDVFLATERGVYRPGETVYLSALVRDDRAKALPGTPLTIAVSRPDGLEVWRRLLPDQGAGGRATVLDLPPGAATGRWSVAAYIDGDARAAGATRFLVEDFAPPRIEVGLETVQTSLRSGDAVQATVAADYLYGAPGADLHGEVRLRIRPRAKAPEGLEGFRFGRARDPLPDAVDRDAVDFTTDADGRYMLDLPLGDLPDTTHPLELRLSASLFDIGGRPLTKRALLPIVTQPLEIGVRPKADSRHSDWRDTLMLDSTGGFEVAVLDDAGVRIARPGLTWRLVREQVDYHWFRRGGDRGGDWDHAITRSDLETAAAGTVDATETGFARIDPALADWEDYRLEVEDPETGLISSIRFFTGWSDGAAVADRTPDAVRISADFAGAAPGDNVRLFVKPPYDAIVQLTLADTRIHDTRAVKIPAAGAEVELTLPEAGIAGVYVLVNAFGRPDGTRAQAPRRAIGALWLPYDRAPHRLAVTIDAPEQVEPDRTTDVTLRIAGAAPGMETYVSLAAVDDGVLQLTNHQAPDPESYYLGRRALGVSLRDLYGRFIDSAGYARGRIRGGGDLAQRSGSANLSNLPKKSRDVVSLFSGVLRAEADGAVTARLAIPDFNGRLRLMAMAWTEDRIGNSQATMTVRSPLIADLATPRFLAPGDQAALTLSAHNLDAPDGLYRFALTAEGAASLGDDGTVQAALNQGDEARKTIILRGDEVGTVDLTLAVSGPQGFVLERTFSLGVRSGNGVETKRLTATLAPGESLRPNPDLLADYYPATASMSVGINPLPDLDLPSHILALARYPYGCAEQTISSTLPLALAPLLMQYYDMRLAGPPSDAVAKGIARLLSMQTANGGFGSWRARGADQPWVSVYAMDFLTFAKARGFAVPEAPYMRGLGRLNGYVGQRNGSPGQRAYALSVLARAGAIDPLQVRRFASVFDRRITRPFGWAQLAAALAWIGDRDAARTLFTRVSELMGNRDYSNYADYGSHLRDLAAATALMAETGAVGRAAILAIAKRTQRAMAREDHISTQERAWLIRAGVALMENSDAEVAIRVDDDPLVLTGGAPFFAQRDGGDAASFLPVLWNDDGEEVEAVQTVIGVPRGVARPSTRSFDLVRRYATQAGGPVDPADLTSGDLVVVIVEGRVKAGGKARALVVDFLPAGLELENAAIGGVEEDGWDWLGGLTQAVFTELRDDRYVAAVDLDATRTRGPNPPSRFRFAYLARAVTPGRYIHAGLFAEDMYQPEVFGRGEAARVVIHPAR